MTTRLDHLILGVNDVDESIAFYRDVIGLSYEGAQDPFSVMRVTPDLVILLAPWGTGGGEHLAFAMTESEFDTTFERAKSAGVEWGYPFHGVGNHEGPGDEFGAFGVGRSIYFHDPNKHLIEIRHY